MDRERGYAMAALLVAMSVMAILLTVAMPAYKQMARREKEEELVFRGQQYARALRLFGMKYANAAPPNVDVLVDQRFLRRKYKDPITNDDFQPLMAGGSLPGAGGSTPQRGSAPTPQFRGPGDTPATSGGGPGRSGSPPGIGGGTPGTTPVGGTGGGVGAPVGGIIGFSSKSKAESIRLYNGRNHYNEWAFVYTPQVQAPGAGGGPGRTGGPGGPGGQQQPGQSPFQPGVGGQRGGGPRGGQPPGTPRGTPGNPGGRGPGASPFTPTSPFQPAQPITPGRGRSG